MFRSEINPGEHADFPRPPPTAHTMDAALLAVGNMPPPPPVVSDANKEGKSWGSRCSFTEIDVGGGSTGKACGSSGVGK